MSSGLMLLLAGDRPLSAVVIWQTLIAQGKKAVRPTLYH